MQLTINKDFYDVDLNFQSTLTKDIGKLVGDDAINAEIFNLIFVRPFEKLFYPVFGLGVELYLFDIGQVAVLATMKNRIEIYLNNNSQRIKEAVVETSSVDENTVLLTIYYLRADTGTLSTFTLFMDVIKGN